MATIVTMDSNVAVVSPRDYNLSEPELVHESLHFCLDGSEGKEGNSDNNNNNTINNNNLRNSNCNPQQPLRPPPPPPAAPCMQVVMKKGLHVSERSDATLSTASDSPHGTNSSLSIKDRQGLLASPMITMSKNSYTQSYFMTDSPQTNASLVPECTSSNVSLQDMFEDQVDPRHPTKAADPTASPRPLQQQHPSLLTPTGGPAELRSTEGVAALQRPLLSGNPLIGTPPTTLYSRPPPLPASVLEDPLYPAMPGASPYQSGSATFTMEEEEEGQEEAYDNHLGLSISPAYPPEAIAPKFSRPKPVLYSAIGSLETCSAHSLKSMWDNKQLPVKGNGFAARNDSNPSMAPTQPSGKANHLRQHSAGAVEGSLSNRLLGGAMSSSQQKPKVTSTQAKFGDSGGVKAATPSPPSGVSRINWEPPRIPTLTADHQKAFKESFRLIQEKVDAAHNKRQPKKATPPPPPPPPTEYQTDPKPATQNLIPSSMRKGSREGGRSSRRDGKDGKKSVKIDDASLQQKERSSRSRTIKPVEMFRPSSDAYTPRMERKKITYKPAEKREPVQKMATTMGTLSRPNFRDALRRVSMLIRQHIVKIEERFKNRPEGPVRRGDEGLFKMSMKDAFSEEKFATCRYKCTVVRVPMARPGMVFGLKKIRPKYEIPTEEEIYEFAHQLFKTVQLSSECSIVCLIYVERLMETSKVPLLASTWRPIFLCGLLLASKVWQDLSSWNIEFASVYPQFSLDAINKLELQFLRMLKWDLYVSSRYVTNCAVPKIVSFCSCAYTNVSPLTAVSTRSITLPSDPLWRSQIFGNVTIAWSVEWTALLHPRHSRFRRERNK
jgi:Cyclin, N-terminal domain